MSTEMFQVSLDAAEAYEAQFVPALFAEWAGYLFEIAQIRPSQRVLDVACGTGIVARTVAERLGDPTGIVGLDINKGMLTVARRLRPDIEWRQGDAGALPFPEDSFDVVLCQAALMFFPDRAKALREMARVTRPGGTIAVQVWAALESQPAYGPFVDIVVRHAGPDARPLLDSYWVLGDLEVLRALIEAARLDVKEVQTVLGSVRLPSVEAFVETEIAATPLAERIDKEIGSSILRDAEVTLSRYITGDVVEIPIRGHILVASKG